MRRLTPPLTAAIALSRQSRSRNPGGPYRVLKTANVGGAGGADYIFAKRSAGCCASARRDARTRGDGDRAGRARF